MKVNEDKWQRMKVYEENESKWRKMRVEEGKWNRKEKVKEVEEAMLEIEDCKSLWKMSGKMGHVATCEDQIR